MEASLSNRTNLTAGHHENGIISDHEIETGRIGYEIFVSRMEIDEIFDQDILHLLVYWHTKRSSKFMPARSDINPLDLSRYLAKIMLIDVLPEYPHFRYRVFGTRIAEWVKFDATGKTVESINPKRYRKMLFATYMECVGARQPVVHRIKWNNDDFHHRYKRVILPLSSDGKHVDMLLVMSVTEDIRVAEKYWSTNDQFIRY